MDPSKLERMKKAIEEMKGSDAFRTEPKHDGDMPLGTHIVLKNLASRPDLNGAMGTIVGSCTRAPGAAAVRYPVKLDSTEVISIKVTNMSMFGFPAEPPRPDAWRPIAGAGIGSIKKSQQEMMADYHAGRFFKPGPPQDLGCVACEPPPLDEVECFFDALAHETLISILIRLSRIDHPALACVCKLWRAMVRNQAFVAARREEGFAEPFIVAIAGEDSRLSRTTHNKCDLLRGDKWVQIASLPHPTGHHCAVVCEEEIYVLGGHHSPKQNMMINPEPCACVMVYSPPRNSWRATDVLTQKRAMPGIAECAGKVYVFGGLDTTFKQGFWAGEFKDMSHCEVYDPKTARWRELAPMPLKCHSARAVTIAATRKIYLMGGELDMQDDSYKFGVVQVYDTTTDTWDVLEREMPIAGGVAFAYDAPCSTEIIVLGGSSSQRRPPSEVPQLAELKRGSEKGINKPPKGAEFGFNFDAPTTNESWLLDTTAGTWTQLASAPKAHTGYTLYRDGDHIRAADDPTLNYNIRLDKWEADPKRPALTNHVWACEIICAPLPF